MHFLLCNYDGISNMNIIVEKARIWSKSNLKAKRVFNDVMLNIIIIHNGELEPARINGLADKTGLHHSLLKSVTIMNSINNSVYIDSYATGKLLQGFNILTKTLSNLKNLN